MIARIRLGLFFSWLLIGFPVPAEAVEGSELPSRVREAVDQWMTTTSPAEEDDWPVYRAALVETEGLEAVLAGLETEASVAARWLRARLAWRYGLLQEAREGFEKLREVTGSARAAFHVAQLLDAEGKEKEAVEAYRAVLEDEAAEPWHGRVRLRLAIFKSAGGNVEGELEDLKAYAESGEDEAFKNRAAVVLALAGKPKDALSLYSAEAIERSTCFKQEIRVAEWAMASKEHVKAQGAAWSALKHAKLKRDRRYALTILAESYRAADQLEDLAARFAAEKSLDEESRFAWIDLLRELGKADEALALFREATTTGEGFTEEMRRELLEICRETGREEVLLEAYDEAIAQQPERLEWRAGLSRFHLEKGDRANGRAVWDGFLEVASTKAVLEAASVVLDLGLPELATGYAEHCVGSGEEVISALQFLFSMHRRRGDDAAMESVLGRMDALAAPDSPDRVQLAECWEQIGGQDRAADVLERLRKALGAENFAPDLEMRLAWLHSETGEEEKAFDYWHSVWLRVDSPGRRRYVEDRLMATASRLGKLADIAIDLEEKLAEGRADKRDSGLLVRLYTKVGDPVSATEIVEEFFKQTGEREREVLEEKARIYVMCNDYYHYEITLRRLMEIDPEGRPEYLTQLAMSCLERGKNDQAREVLREMRELEKNAASAEFEAGVLKIAGMHEEATGAYWRGIGEQPDRIDAYLLLGDSLRTVGKARQAQGVFQYLVENADQDDLFTIAVDGLLNARVGQPVLRWARRAILERIAERDDKVYLYQLLGDVSEELRDQSMMMRALAETLPIAGERRTGQLRELVELSKVGVGRSSFSSAAAGRSAKDRDALMRFGRRLIGMGEAVPPQVHLDLGQAFLDGGDVRSAAKTFVRAEDLSDYAGFQRKVADSFEQKRYVKSAVRVVEGLLLGEHVDVGLLLKLGELKEQLGNDVDAREAYEWALDQLIDVQPMISATDEALTEGPQFAWARNQDLYDRYYHRVLTDLLATAGDDEALTTFLEGQEQALASDLSQLCGLDRPVGERLLKRSPRVQKRAALIRRIAVAFDELRCVKRVGEMILRGFPEDETAIPEVMQSLLTFGLEGQASALLEEFASHPSAEAGERYLERVRGGQGEAGLLQTLVEADEAEGRRILRRAVTEEGSLSGGLGGDLFTAARVMDDKPTLLRFARRAVMEAPSEQVWTFTSILGRVWSHLEPRDRDVLVNLVEQKLEGLESSSNRSLPFYLEQLNQLTGRDFRLSQDDVRDALQDMLSRSGYYLNSIASLFNVLQLEDYAPLLKEAYRKAKKSDRLQMLFNLLKGRQAEMSEDLADLFKELVRDAAADGAGGVWEAWNKARTAQREGKPKQFGEIAEILGELGEGLDEEERANLETVRATLLLQCGRTEEAVSLALEVQELALVKEDAVEANALRAMQQAFLPAHLEALLGAFDEAIHVEGADRLELTRQKIAFIRQARSDREELLLAQLLQATEDFPDEKGFQEEHRQLLESHGLVWEAIQLQEKLVDEAPEDVAARNRLAALWNRLEHPLKARRVKEALAEAEAPSEEGVSEKASALVPQAQGQSQVVTASKPASATAGTTSTVTTPAAPIVAKTTAASAASTVGKSSEASDGDDGSDGSEEEKEEMLPPASMSEIKKAAEAGDWEAVQRLFRRVWRQFSMLDRPRHYAYSTNSLARYRWPEASSRKAARSLLGSPLGGMKQYLTKSPVDPPAAAQMRQRAPVKTIFEALGDEEVVQREVERALRTLAPNQYRGAVFAKQVDVLAEHRVAELGLDGAIDETLSRLRASEDFLPLEKALSFALLDRSVTEGVSGDEICVLALREALFDRVRGGDAMALGQLARCLARMGENDRAVKLYHWCAAKTMFTPHDYGDGRLSTRGLVNDIRELLEGSDRIRALEGVFALSRPSQRAANYLVPYYLLVLNTWKEVLPAEEALSRTQAICEEVIRDFPENPILMKLASVFLGSGGLVDEGIAALEKALSTVPVAGANGMVMVYNPNGTVYYTSSSSRQRAPGFGEAEMRTFFPDSLSDWKAPGLWLAKLSEMAERVAASGGLSTSEAVRMLSLTAVNQYDLGDLVGAAISLRRLTNLSDRSVEDQLWVWDAAEHLGMDETWREIGRALFEDRILPVTRLPLLIEDVARADGVEAALTLGGDAWDYTAHPEMVSACLAVADAAGREEARSRWEARRAELLSETEAPSRYGFVVSQGETAMLFRHEELAKEKVIETAISEETHTLTFDAESGAIDVWRGTEAASEAEREPVLPVITLIAEWRQAHPEGQVYWVTLLENTKTYALKKGEPGWRYHDDVAPPPAGWASPDFDDGQWKEGSSPLGYGESVSTTLSFGGDPTNKTLTAYFRKTIEVEEPESWVKTFAELECDDGAVLYLNGEEVHRMNMRASDPDTHATMAAGKGEKGNPKRFFIDRDLWQKGRNVLAVSVHQADTGSSDLFLNLEIRVVTQADLQEASEDDESD